MKIIRSTILKRITTFALLLAMVAGMATALGRKADAGSIPNGCYRVTLKCYNKTSTFTKDFSATPPYASFTLPTQTSDQYGTFAGWKDESTGTIYKAGYTFTVNGHKNFIAVWNTSVTFYSYDGKVISSQSITTGNKYSLPKAPARSGYEFLGWYCGNQEITANTICMTGMRHEITANYVTLKTACQRIDNRLWGVNSAKGIAKYKSNKTLGGGYIYQHEHYTGGGICTSCAVANLLNRKLVLYTNSNATVFDYYADVLPVMYNVSKSSISVYTPSKNGYRVKMASNRSYSEERSFTKAGKTYTTKVDATIRNKKADSNTSSDNAKAKAAYLASMLEKHKEGVVLWTRGHAMVITYYEKNSSSPVGYKFYAVDTGGSVGSYEKGSYDYNSFCPIEYAFNYTDKAHGNKSMATLLNDPSAYIIYIK